MFATSPYHIYYYGLVISYAALRSYIRLTEDIFVKYHNLYASAEESFGDEEAGVREKG